jgi:alpha-L-fucosidase
VPYDGNLTLADGKGKWWEGYDPRLLYGVDLREYKGWDQDAWAPASGILVNHLDYCRWYATNWSLRIIDAINKYDPDFIYTDGVQPYPFYGQGAESGYKCDAMARVIADFYNHNLEKHGKVDNFSIVKFHPPSPGVVTTFEDNWPPGIKTDQPWIGETANGDWFYAPGFVNDPGALIRHMLECVSRDGCFCVNIAMLPDGSLDESTTKMLKDIGTWMTTNGEAIYGSKAWVKYGESTAARINSLPTGKLGRAQADKKFDAGDFRFTVGKDGAVYAICLTVPPAGTELKITSLGTDAKLLDKPVKFVSLLGSNAKLEWTQQADGLVIKCPAEMPMKISAAFKIGL